jgi:uncharacterized protein GlcG (DUF336 family)
MGGAMLASIQIAEHKARAAVTFSTPEEGLSQDEIVSEAGAATINKLPAKTIK